MSFKAFRGVEHAVIFYPETDGTICRTEAIVSFYGVVANGSPVELTTVYYDQQEEVNRMLGILARTKPHVLAVEQVDRVHRRRIVRNVADLQANAFPDPDRRIPVGMILRADDQTDVDCFFNRMRQLRRAAV